MIALRDIRAGRVFIFIRFYGSEKHCHAYQLALEQMAQYGCYVSHTQTQTHTFMRAHEFCEHEPDSSNPDDSMRPVNKRSSGWQLFGEDAPFLSYFFSSFSFSFCLLAQVRAFKATSNLDQSVQQCL